MLPLTILLPVLVSRLSKPTNTPSKMTLGVSKVPIILEVTPSILGPTIIPSSVGASFGARRGYFPSPSLPLAVDLVVLLGAKPLLALGVLLTDATVSLLLDAAAV